MWGAVAAVEVAFGRIAVEGTDVVAEAIAEPRSRALACGDAGGDGWRLCIEKT